jgi:serine/threonine protein kinase
MNDNNSLKIMGNCATSENEQVFTSSSHGFKKIQAVGKGSYGKVWKVLQESTGNHFAMKEMNKYLIFNKKSTGFIMNERLLLGILRHPFIVNLYFAYQDKENLYLVMDLKEGGDLRYYFQQHLTISETSLKFISACIVTALEYVHSNRIIHRDLKPENLVFDRQGYLHLTDFGIARGSDQDNTGIVNGTPGYMSPEVLCNQNHSTVSDFFSLGVILFEATTGARPYFGSTRKEIREAVLKKQVKMPEPSPWTKQMKDFTNKLITRKPEKRLGSKGIEELKQHPWFDGFDWEKLYAKALESPVKIENDENFDAKQVNESFGKLGVLRNDFQKIFSGFFFDSSLQ